MPKTLSSIVLAVVLFTNVVIAGVLFPLPHQSKEPPGADDTGSTEQGVMDIATANNRFAFVSTWKYKVLILVKSLSR